jgi:hypothetical protein
LKIFRRHIDVSQNLSQKSDPNFFALVNRHDRLSAVGVLQNHVASALPDLLETGPA